MYSGTLSDRKNLNQGSHREFKEAVLLD